MIGLFVVTGVLICAVTIVWVGASKYFEKGSMYVTYFDESVQGLQRDSMVKYRGVDVGRIEKIRVAPDNKLIEVVMKIDLKDDLERNAVAKLKAAGITGIVFVELDRKESEERDLSPEINFAAEYPIIPSRPSDIRQILSGIDDVISKLQQIDFRGVVDQVTSTARTAEGFLSSEKTKKIMANLESSSVALDKSMNRMEKILTEGDVEGTLKEAKRTLAEARSLIAGTQEEIKAMRLADTATKANQVVDSLARSTGRSAADIQTATNNLRQASENLERLLERLEANPSDLIFGKPPALRRGE
jgi:phospholipid/cholesterol/gamma-HCH transport system substrate-binding protein